MRTFALRERLLVGGVLTAVVSAAPTASVMAQQKAAPPDFSSNQVGWVGVGGGGPGFVAVPGHLPPVANDPTHPFVPNGTRAQPTYRIADLSNPNLKPWVKERMKKDNDEVLAGKIAFTARSPNHPALERRAGDRQATQMTGANELFWYVKSDSKIRNFKDASDQTTVAFSATGSPSNLVLLELLRQAGSRAKPTATGGLPGTLTAVKRFYLRVMCLCIQQSRYFEGHSLMFEILCSESDGEAAFAIATGFCDREEARRTVEDWINRRFPGSTYDEGQACWWLLDCGHTYRVAVEPSGFVVQ
jgi:hypothetical protein